MWSQNLAEMAKRGRVATHSREAEALRAATQRRNAAALKAWNPSNKPAWLTEEIYREKIQPRLAEITIPAIASALCISKPYATDIRRGVRVPHPRHWLTLARLVGVELRGIADDDGIFRQASGNEAFPLDTEDSFR